MRSPLRTTCTRRKNAGLTLACCGWFAVLVSLCLLLLWPGCRKDTGSEAKSAQSQPTVEPILVMGVDGLEWDVILPMLQEGRLPNLAKIMETGCWGKLDTVVPTFSPVVWTTIATGKGLRKHGIQHFAYRKPDGGVTLFDSTDRKTKALWNIVSDYGKSVATIGWWMTYPVEEINGVMVAQTNTKAQLDTRAGRHVWKGTLFKGVPGQVHPDHRQSEMISILEEVERNLPDLTREVFGEFRSPLSLLGQRLWNNCQWVFRADATYLRIALKLAEEDPIPDLTLFYFGGPDVVGHRFWRYMKPGLYAHRPTAEQIANFGTIVEDYYAYSDQALGELRKAYGPDLTVFVISDHGMKPVNTHARFDPDDPPSNINSAEHQDAPPGVFFAAGPHIRKSPVIDSIHSPWRTHIAHADLQTVGSVLDIAATVLAMMRIPIGDDMEGRVATQIFRDEFQIDRQPARVATHDTAEWLARREGRVLPHPGEQERLEQLRSLGYIYGGQDK
ncbi:MAG: alkaline phosphatase family protein [Planctomycetota bacterium]